MANFVVPSVNIRCWELKRTRAGRFSTSVIRGEADVSGRRFSNREKNVVEMPTTARPINDLEDADSIRDLGEFPLQTDATSECRYWWLRILDLNPSNQWR